MPIQQAPQEAIDYLRNNPELSDKFKEKYGYIPAPQAAVDHLKENPDLSPYFIEKYGYLPEDTNTKVKNFDPNDPEVSKLKSKSITAGAAEAIRRWETFPIKLAAQGLGGVYEGARQGLKGNSIPEGIVKGVEETGQNIANLDPTTTQGGELADRAINRGLDYLSQGADIVGGKVSDITGSPALGAATYTGLNFLPFIAAHKAANKIIGPKEGYLPSQAGTQVPGEWPNREPQPSSVMSPEQSQTAPQAPELTPQEQRIVNLKNMLDRTEDPQVQKVIAKQIKDQQFLIESGNRLDSLTKSIAEAHDLNDTQTVNALLKVKNDILKKIGQIQKTSDTVNKAADEHKARLLEFTPEDNTLSLKPDDNSYKPTSEDYHPNQIEQKDNYNPDEALEGLRRSSKLDQYALKDKAPIEEPNNNVITNQGKPLELAHDEYSPNTSVKDALDAAYKSRAAEGRGLGKNEWMSKLSKGEVPDKVNEGYDALETEKARQENSAWEEQDYHNGKKVPIDISGKPYEVHMSDDNFSSVQAKEISEKNSPPLHNDHIQSIVDLMTSKWKTKPKINIVDNRQSLPENYRNHPSVNDNTVAIHTNDGIYLLRDKMTSPDMVKQSVLHEVLGHYGLRGAFGDKLNSVLDRISITRPELISQKIKERNLGNRKDLNSTEKLRLAAEEVLAEFAESDPRNSFVRNAIAAIKEKLRDWGLLNKDHISDEEIIRQYINPSRKYLESYHERTSLIGKDVHSMDSVDKFIDEDIKPTAKEISKNFKGIGDGILKLMSPQSRSQNAKTSANVLREHGAQLAIRLDRTRKSLKEAHDLFQKLGKEGGIKFQIAMEKGQVPSEFKQISDELRKLLDSKASEVMALGKDSFDNFIENYFPHIWENPQEASAKLQSARQGKLEGSKAFLKNRQIQSIEFGLELGLKPKYSNPIDAVLSKVHEMDRYILGQKTVQEFIDKGLAKYYTSGTEVPQGMQMLNSAIGRIFVPSDSKLGAIHNPLKENVKKKGNWYLPEDVAQVVNNHLSPGLREKVPGFKGYMYIANSLNQAQLGLSAFHAGFTSMDVIVSKNALGLQYLTDGKIGKAASQIAQGTILAPVTPFTTALKGHQLYKAWMDESHITSPELRNVLDSLVAAGGRVKVDELYVTNAYNKMIDAWRSGNPLGALVRAPLGIVDLFAKPVMEWLVPRQKLGVFYDMAMRELEKMPADVSRDQMRDRLGKLWDSVDNRLGQLVYDNLFWNKAVKDLSMATIRSVGWNLGTLRELGGGVGDIGGITKKVIKGEKDIELTSRAAYVISLPLTVGFIGGMIGYLSGNPPQELIDYFYPKTGEKDINGNPLRVQLPTYLKDVVEYYHDPKQTALNKLHPTLQMVSEMMQNKDFFGTEIVHEDDPFYQKGLDVIEYLGKQFVPFSITNQSKLKESGAGSNTQLAGYFGFPKAPSWLEQTDAQRKANELMLESLPKGSRTKEQFDKAQIKKQIVAGIRSPDKDIKLNAVNKLNDMFRNGEIDHRTFIEINKQAISDPLSYELNRLDAKQSMRVWEVANDDEKKKIKQMMIMKILRSNLSPNEKQGFLNEINK